MNCPYCDQVLSEGTRFCSNCGAEVKEEAPAAKEQETPPAQPAPQPTVVYVSPPAKKDEISPQYKPLTAWNYFWLQILFCIPIVGFVFLIVFSCSSANLNRRNFARSYWCWLIVALIITVITLILVYALGLNILSSF